MKTKSALFLLLTVGLLFFALYAGAVVPEGLFGGGDGRGDAMAEILGQTMDSITVTAPNGGENWTAGSSHDITWTSTGTIANVNIDYSTDNGSSWTSVVTSTTNDGSYNWTVPATPSVNCLIWINDSANGDTLDKSNAVFTIIAAVTETVSVPTAPTGPATGTIATSYDFSTGGSISSLGHSVQYDFDWDDGYASGWLAEGTTQASHSWAAAGTYNVRAMARCVTHTNIESLWSETHAMVIPATGKASCDFNGDGRSDIAVWRPSSGYWYIKDQGESQWGMNGDIPVPKDFNGDGQTDIAVWRPRSGYWYIMGQGDYQWGANGDIPVSADYNADGKDELAVFRPGNGYWYILYPGTGSYDAWRWGQAGDIPVVGDYDHDGYADMAVYRPSDGTWYIRKSSDWGMISCKWGTGNDIPVPGDYDHDGYADMAVYRPADGTWYILKSSDWGMISYKWGTGDDIPVTNDYDGDGKTDITVWRPGNGYWYIKDQADYQWGMNSDIPLD